MVILRRGPGEDPVLARAALAVLARIAVVEDGLQAEPKEDTNVGIP